MDALGFGFEHVVELFIWIRCFSVYGSRTLQESD